MSNWKARLHPEVSRAEEAVFQELSRQGLTTAMVTQKPIVLRQTIPDFFWIEKRKCVYLDGEEVHRNKQELDEEITDMLEQRDFQVLRITYKPPMSRERLLAVVAEIREFIGEPDAQATVNR